MSFFELFDQFFQLEAEQTIPPMAAKLYMYWLHEFNNASPRWPAKLHRRANQVYADLNIDKKTLEKATEQLERRGLIRHIAGTKLTAGTWFLNYDSAAEWANVEGKNSPSESQISPLSGGNNTPENSNWSLVKGKNSPPIRNRPEESRTDHTIPASACVGEAAEEITPAPLPAKNSQLVPPVAEPPHAAESRPVAAAELPAALLAEVKALATEMGQLWGFSEQHGFPGWNRLYTFAKHQAQHGQLAELRKQLAGYQAGHMRPGVRAHRLADWLGDPKHPDGAYTDGVWCSCQWPAIAAQVQARPGEQPTATATRPGSSPTQARKEAKW